LLPGLLILPLMGIQRGILLMAVLNVCLGIVILLSRWKQARAAAAATAVVFVVCAFFLERMPLGFQFPSEFQTAKDAVLFYKEGGLVTTKVWATADTGYKVISVDGIGIGGTSDSDFKQQILAHLPKLLLKSYRSELSVGLGSGILAGESARHAALKRIVCVELARGVVEGARYFREENFDILNDPRTAIVTDDIADFLQTSAERFDIISADEKTTGKFASNAMSYSKEYYALLRQHLAPGGLVIQWMPTDLPPTQYTLAMRTFLDSFPHVMLWYFPPVGRFTMSNTFLVGSDDRIDIDPAWMRQALERDPASFQGIRKYGLTTSDSVLAHFIATEETLRPAFPAGPVNTLEKPYYEFYSPRDYAVPAAERTLANHGLLMSFRERDIAGAATRGPATGAIRQNEAFRAEGIFFDGYARQLQGEDAPAVLRQYGQAIGMAPGNMNLRNEVVSYLNSEVRAHYYQGDTAGAAAYLRQAAELCPENAEVHYDYAMMLLYVNEADLGIGELQRALALNPGFVPALRNLGGVYAALGQMDKAADLWQKALAINPDDVETLVLYGGYLVEQRGSSEGKQYLRKAYRLAPKNPHILDQYNLLHGR
jgi:spermidine synthase